ncbi:MAG: 50S ribosomal protein L19 [Candidatus Omnitrophica bacterium]|nr:50S ribosomal protein L19 [Candidatus Omnitrophota bacterium]MBI2495979.1 50S ribosomal protein L19 [Candidatus Omnitrophota bacterium]MBI3020756.1 50S ribosomal protein L19 [Candidatus Omnitrophota bacterium]MBI3083067.1 50S ribosomal protein L19 [Candidatus Omnitrophota bacterium]
MEWLQWVHGANQPAMPATFGPGDDVRVWFKILERGKERLGQFEGIVIRCRGSGASKTFTVRRVTYGEGVERVFPLDAKTVSKIEVLRRGKVRRSRLYFLRRTIGKSRISSEKIPGALEQPSGGIPIVNVSAETDAPGERSEAAVAAADKPAGGVPPQP